MSLVVMVHHLGHCILLFLLPQWLTSSNWKADVSTHVVKVGSVTGDRTGEQAGCCCHFGVFHRHHPHSASFDSPAAESFLCKKAAAVHAQACKDEAELNSPQSIINSPWLHFLIQFWRVSPTAQKCVSVCSDMLSRSLKSSRFLWKIQRFRTFTV